MKKFIAKTLSILLTLTLVVTATVTSFAYETEDLPAVNTSKSNSATVHTEDFRVESNEQGVASVDELPDFIEFLELIHQTPVLRVLFAPLLALVSFIYMISVYVAML